MTGFSGGRPARRAEGALTDVAFDPGMALPEVGAEARPEHDTHAGDRVSGVLEAIDAGGHVRCCSVVVEVGSGPGEAWHAIARHARQRGLVPVAAGELEHFGRLPAAERQRTIVLLVPPAGLGGAEVARAAALVATGTRVRAVIGVGRRWPGVPAVGPDESRGYERLLVRGPARGPGVQPRVADARPRPPDAGAAAARSLERGDPRGAGRAARAAIDEACAARDGEAALDALGLLGRARLECLDVPEAARVLDAALALARVGCRSRVDACRVGLARCRIEQGETDEALAVLARVAAPPGTRVFALAREAEADAYLATRRLAEAGLAVAALLSGRRADGHGGASACAAAARLHLALGDYAGVCRHVAAGLRAGGSCGSRAAVVALRLVAAEAATRFGGEDDRRSAVSALRRAHASVTSPVLREAARRVLTLAGRRRTTETPTTGIGPHGVGEGGVAVSEELFELLTICHEAEDDGPALERLCAALRERLDASAVCVFGDGATGRLVSVGLPRGPSPATAQRAVATGQLVPASMVCDGWEAAAPVRYGGLTIGAVTCRWPVDTALDPRRVDRLLATAAAACAPSLRAALERQAVSSLTCADDLGLIGSSPAMAEVRRSIRRAAGAPFQVLIEGESGSGKELVARAVHRAGPRRQRRMCAINCAALPDDLIEAELFGHARGAFTGAVAERGGVFEEADGGTLFLDEVSELSPRAQAKLLRVLQEGEVRRLGEGLPRRIDVRIIAATNKSLALEAAAGRFRTDLRYRLEVLRITVPPLRDRREDIPLLAARFWADCSPRAGSRALLDRTAVEALTRYDWPGNVRELQNVMAAIAVHAPRRGRVVALDLPAALRGGASAPPCTLDEARRAFEVSFVREALRRAGGRRAAVARELGLSRQGLAKLLVRLELAHERGDGAAGAASGVGAAPPAGARPAGGA